MLAAGCLFLSAASWAQGYRLDGNTVVTDANVTFKPGTAQLAPAATPALEAIKKYLADKSYISTLRIEGHVANGGNIQSLSEQRAVAVAKWLIAHGTDCTRLLPIGFGDTKPAFDDAAPGEDNRNTRIVFVNAALRGHAIGGMPMDGGGHATGDPCR